MIIGIDISSIQYGTGVSNYTLNLVKNLIKIDKKNTYKLFFASARNSVPKEIAKLASGRVKIKRCHLPLPLLAFVWNKLHILPIEFFIGKCHLFHCSDYTHPPTVRAKTIHTIHDLTSFLYPKWQDKKIIKNHQLKMKRAIKKASHFICVSQNTQNDLLRLFPQIKKQNTSVVYEAHEAKYQNFNKLNKKTKRKQIKKIKDKYNLNNFFLAQGTREPRKNLKRLIRAFINFKMDNPKSNLDLAITGKYGWGKDISKDQPSYIKILGYIPESDMTPIHAAATALIYPSLYEGFGLPLLKSMAVGTPVITSQTSSTGEIAQDNAILVNPKSIEDIKTAIQEISTNSTLRQVLKRKGINYSKKFSWKKTALQTLKIYKIINNSQ